MVSARHVFEFCDIRKNHTFRLGRFVILRWTALVEGVVSRGVR